MKTKIDYKEIIKIIDLLEERNLSEFELEIEDLKIKISRAPQQSNSKEIASTAFAGTAIASPAPIDKEPSNDEEELHLVTSPMVGTFYRSPDPSAPPFVDKGEDVTKNQTLCIIEAMKLMNEIEADIDGILEEVYIKNGKPVEYGQKLFAIKPKS